MTRPFPTVTSGTGSGSALPVPTAFKGRGGHGAVAQATIDPLMMASRFVVDVQSVISREKDPTEFGVVSIGSLHAGTAGNIIPDEAVLLGTIRTFKPDVRARMLDGIERTAKAVATMANAPAPDIQIVEGIKAVINDPAVVATAEKVLNVAFGEKLSLTPANTTSEDFSEFAGSGVPLMMFNIGVYEPEKWAAANKSGTPLPGNHSPQFAPVPKPTIRTGVTAMTLAVLSAEGQGAVTARPSSSEARARPDHDLKSGCGPSRRLLRQHKGGRYRSEADMTCRFHATNRDSPTQ